MAEQYTSFEDALKELRLKDEELKRLVSENVIRAFRDGDRMKLRREDVEKLRSELSGRGATEELVFEDDGGDEPGMATVPLSEAETMSEKTPAKKPAARPSAKSASSSSSASLKKPAAIKARTSTRRESAPAEEEGNEGMLVKAALVVSFLLLLVAVPVALDAVKGTAGISAAFLKAPR